VVPPVVALLQQPGASSIRPEIFVMGLLWRGNSRSCPPRSGRCWWKVTKRSSSRVHDWQSKAWQRLTPQHRPNGDNHSWQFAELRWPVRYEQLNQRLAASKADNRSRAAAEAKRVRADDESYQQWALRSPLRDEATDNPE